MIHYVVTGRHRYTIDAYLASRGRGVADLVRPIGYDELIQAESVPAGVYVFSDVERLRPPWREMAVEVWQALADAGSLLLNHPTRSLRRAALLARLAELGINDFTARPAADGNRPDRYPVFLRLANDHGGARSGLLPDQPTLEHALRALEPGGPGPENHLVVEFCDTADTAGVYRKYACFVVGDRVIARHLFFGRDWMLKTPQCFDPELLEEERRFVESNPHADRLLSVFRIAGIEYGRVDYAVGRDGRLRIWEINTNPYISSPEDAGGEAREWVGRHFAQRFDAALRQLADRGSSAAVRLVTLPEPRNWPGPGWPSVPRPAAWPGRIARRLLRAAGLGGWEERVMGVARRLRYGPGSAGASDGRASSGGA